MSTLTYIAIFTRVAELASFTQAADALGLPKATVSNAVQTLETTLGARLLHRTTRKVALTQDGQAFYERSKDVLTDMDELQTMFQQPGKQGLSGRVRVDMATGLARHAVLPYLPKLLKAHPQLEIELSSTDRRVDLVREGFDCVLRVGMVNEPGLIARPLGHLRMINCASPSYVKVHGKPKTLADLATHHLVHYVNVLGAKSGGFEWHNKDARSNDPQNHSVSMHGAITVNNADAYTTACLSGLGIIQAPAVGLIEHIAQGRLIALLPKYVAAPMPLTLLYANRRNLSKRVRVVMDWLAVMMTDHLASDR
jgi:DNA-binding transcriptional LysR family regulator